MIKHVGKHDQRKAVLLFREVPGDDEMCLIVYTDKLPALIHDPMMKCIESDVGQSSNDISGPLSRTLMDSGENVLQTLHSHGYIRKVPTNQMIITPNAQTTIRLDELNKVIREMDSGDAAKKRLAEMDSQAGIKDPAKSLSRLNESEAAAAPVAEPLAPPADGILTDEHIAHGQLQQATTMKADAQRLLNEAANLEEEAYTLVPSLKPKATRKKAAPKAKAKTGVKRGPGRPKKNAASST